MIEIAPNVDASELFTPSPKPLTSAVQPMDVSATPTSATIIVIPRERVRNCV
jgi:hypothetical protein